jgi:hypothetical protein
VNKDILVSKAQLVIEARRVKMVRMDKMVPLVKEVKEVQLD